MGKAKKETPRALDVARWAGLTFLDGSPIPGATPPPPAVAEGFEILDAVAEAGTWRDPRALVRLVAPDARWVFGLDQPTTRSRLRAAVARVAWELDRLANGIAERELAVADARRGEEAIAAAFAALDLGFVRDELAPDFGAGGLGADVFAALDRLAAVSPSYLDATRGEVAQGLAALQRLRRDLAGARAAAAPRHRLPDDRRLFGLMRLAEVFALLSGELPAFHAQRLVEGTPPTKRRRWWRFLMVRFAVSPLLPSTRTDGQSRTWSGRTSSSAIPPVGASSLGGCNRRAC